MSALEKILAKGDEVAIKAARHTASYICRWNKQDEAERRAAANDNRTVKYPGIVCSAEFVNGFVPPDYHIDGIAQSGFFYSLTAMTGTGKTAALLLITALTALGKPLGDLEVRKGRVLFLPGRIPTTSQCAGLPCRITWASTPTTSTFIFFRGLSRSQKCSMPSGKTSHGSAASL